MEERERQTLVFNGIRYDGVLTHPRRKARSSNRLPSTIWVRENAKTQLLDVAEALGYTYKLVDQVTRVYGGSRRIRYGKFHLVNSDNVSGLRKPWE